jgi:hypothetical protein
MDLGELVPPGNYECWRVVCTVQPNVYGWQTETSPPFITRGGAIAGAGSYRSKIDDSRGKAMSSPWHQTNMASSQNILYPDGEPEEGEITWENTWGETVAVKRGSLIIGS